MSVLTVTGAAKSFGQVQALRGVSLEVAAGEMLALLGPNGAGKTTLIRAIAGRVTLDAGEIRVFDTPVVPRRTPRALGIVPQELAVYPLLSATENLSAFGALQGLSGATLTDRVRWALDRCGLTDRADEPVRAFSGGMKRRLNIACGVLHHPRVVLLDEPTVGVDPQSRDRIYDMLAELVAGGMALLLTTHHLEEAEARCSRTVIIDHGRVIASGTLGELVERTVGHHRLVSLRVAGDLPDPGVLPSLDPHRVAGDARTLHARMDDVAAELPALLGEVGRAGLQIQDVEVRGPSLQSVFIHLTGRELRG